MPNTYLFGAAASSATVLAGAAGAGARYDSLRNQDKNSNLIGPDDKPLLVVDALMNSLQGRVYKFTHKAIWGCWILLPAGVHTARDVVNTLVELPPPEHWAFVARAECKALDPPQVAYFIAQFGEGNFIKPKEEVGLDDDNGDFKKPVEEIGRDGDNTVPFGALLQERNKAHAALSIVQGPLNPDVWIHSPELRPKRYVYKGMRLRSPVFREDEWKLMKKPMKLRELNDCIYDTKCTGKKYDRFNNNCQHFSVALFKKL